MKSFRFSGVLDKLQTNSWHNEGYLTSSEMADLFAVTPITINKWGRQGKFKQFKISYCKLLTPIPEVRKFIDSLKPIKRDW